MSHVTFNPRSSMLALTLYIVVVMAIGLTVWRKVSVLQSRLPL